MAARAQRRLAGFSQSMVNETLELLTTMAQERPRGGRGSGS